MNTAATRSAIRRASQQARNAMRTLDDAQAAELLQIYEQSAQEIRGLLGAAVDANSLVPVAGLRRLLAEVDDAIDALALRRQDLLHSGLEQASTLGVRPYTVEGVAATGRAGAAVLDSGAAARINYEAVQFVLEFRAADGLNLSDRVWRIDAGAKEVLKRAIGQAVVQGWDAQRAAAQFMYSGQAVPADVAQRLAGAKLPALEQRTADLLVGQNGEVWQADRVFRTEINRAHGTAFQRGAEKTPGFGGFRFLLSPRHPRADICFRAGTLITTRRGLVPIEKVKIGDQALTHLGRWRSVVRLYQSASGPNGLIRLYFPAGKNRSQEVVMTPNHPVLTPSGWTAAGDLKTGSAVVCLATDAPWLQQPCGAGASRTASPDSGETASAAAAKTADPARRDAHARRAWSTARTGVASWHQPTGLPRFGAAMRLLSCFHPSRLGYSPRCAGPTATAETAPNAGTCWGGACQSSGYQRPAWARRQCSNIFDPGCTTQTVLRMWCMSWAWLRGLGHSTRWSNTRWLAPELCALGPETAPRSLGKWLARVYRGSSIAWHTHDCKTACLPCASRAPTDQGLVQAAWRSVRKVLGFSCPNHIAFATHHPIVDKLPATGEQVFNLEVDEDHSYIAAGVVVHNCDLLAAQNLYGLGPGVYPDAATCPWPAHPNTLSFTEMVFADEVSAADRAGKETPLAALNRLGADVRAGVLGVEKAKLWEQGALRQGMIRSPLYKVKARLARQGVA